jgi:hypothetical protein
VADKKVSQLAALSQPEAEDLLLIIDDPNGTPVSKRVTVKTLFGRVKANTMIVSSNTYITANATFTNRVVANTFIVAADRVRITTPRTPASSNTVSEGLSAGHMFYDATYLYVCVNGTTIKRAALSSF